MAEEGLKISSLNPAGTLGGTEAAPIVQSGTTVKTTLKEIADLEKSEIINDLTTGGATKFASAETVKTLQTNKLDKTSVKTVAGTSNTDVVSQKFTTDQLALKAEKVTGATAGNFAGLDVNGNLTDSGKKATDFELADATILKEADVKSEFGNSLGKPISQKFFTDHLSDSLWYGIQWDVRVASTVVTRIGNAILHKTLPIQSGMRRCLLKDDGTVNYYLLETDSTKKEDGTGALLDGTDGQVMVEIPAHYRRFDFDGYVATCKISLFELPGFHYVPLSYRSAYEAALDRTIPETPKLASVVNNTVNFRGGNNTSVWDGTYRTLLCRPATSISLTNFRTYARNRGGAGKNGKGWNCDVYDIQKACHWLYLIEYANTNCQLPYNAESDANGYKQGGLGDGVSTLELSLWNTINGHNPFVPCGHTNSLGNRSGIVPFIMPSEYGALTVQVPSYRGLENPYGHIWSWTDGCKCRIQSVASGALSQFYVCANPDNFQDTDYTNYVLRGLLSRTNGYVKKMIVGEYGENMLSEVGGSSTTYFSDYFYTGIPASGEAQSGVLFGGAADNGAGGGFGASSTDSAAGRADAFIGSRLCFIPA